jgi:hypothetical protein
MVYEEEDFQPMQYGYHLNPDISEQRIIGMLREVEEELHRKIRSKQSGVNLNVLKIHFIVFNKPTSRLKSKLYMSGLSLSECSIKL